MKRVFRYASLVKFSHTLFAMPFALTGYFYALWSTDTSFEWLLLVKILLAMVFARNTAMGFNRYADRDIDAKNPRTASREIPAGTISPRNAMIFVIVNAALFILTALWINRLAFYLSPAALLIITGYSLTKRFTMWSHLVLGVALGIAPVGAYISVTGSVALFPVLLAGLVITWTGGFDIVYSLQDAGFDRENSLHSIPAKLGFRGASAVSIILHLVTVYAVIITGMLFHRGSLYTAGAVIFIAMMTVQHFLTTPKLLPRMGATFGLVNGLASVCYAVFTILDFISTPLPDVSLPSVW